MTIPRLIACCVLFTLVMIGVRFAAHGVVDNYGYAGGLVMIAIIMGGAWLYDVRQRDPR